MKWLVTFVAGILVGAFAIFYWLNFSSSPIATKVPAIILPLPVAKVVEKAEEIKASIKSLPMETAAPLPSLPSIPLPAESASLAQPDLASRHLLIPVTGIEAKNLHDTYNELRGGGTRPHEALDIMASRGTPVVAVENGLIKKLFNSKPGGLTIYQFDPTEKYTYYYAHLDRYADSLKEGMTVKRGDILGYVGSTGNAGADSPHLHFAIFTLEPEKRWWKGTPLNPYPLFTNTR